MAIDGRRTYVRPNFKTLNIPCSLFHSELSNVPLISVVPLNQVTVGTGFPPPASHFSSSWVPSLKGPIVVPLSMGDPSLNVMRWYVGRAMGEEEWERKGGGVLGHSVGSSNMHKNRLPVIVCKMNLVP